MFQKYFTSVLILTFTISLHAQDLIQNTRSGVNSSSKNALVKRSAELIADRKASGGKFQSAELFQLSSGQLTQQQQYSDVVGEAAFLQLSIDRLQQLLAKAPLDLRFVLPVSNQSEVELEVTQVNNLSPHFTITTAVGKVGVDEYPSIFYRGMVKDDTNSSVTLSVFDQQLRAIITDSNGTYVLGKLPGYEDEYVFYNDQQLKIANDFECHTPFEDAVFTPVESPVAQVEGSMLSKCIEVYVECDYAFYRYMGSSVSATAVNALALFHESATIYFNEDIDISISELYVWDAVDPYASATDTDGTLAAFENNRASFNGDMAHLLTGRSMGGKASKLGGLCDFYDYGAKPYCVSGGLTDTFNLFPTYSWDVYVVTHEMGHVLGSPHTQACYWGDSGNTAIDNCYCTENRTDIGGASSCSSGPDPGMNGGTIMSYCHLGTTTNNSPYNGCTLPSFPNPGINLNNGFGVEPGHLIRSRISGATCIGSGSCDCTNFTNRTISSFNAAVYEASNTIFVQGNININNDRTPVVLRAGNRIEITSLETFANTIFIAETGSDICSFSSSTFNSVVGREVEDDSNKKVVTTAFEELDIFPNPFDQETTIRFNLATPSQLSIQLVNALGRNVQTVLNPSVLAAGEHTFSINGNQLPEGLYTVLLRSSKGDTTRPLVIVHND